MLLRGSGLRADMLVVFDRTSVAVQSFVSDEELVCVAPPHAEGLRCFDINFQSSHLIGFVFAKKKALLICLLYAMMPLQLALQL